MPSIKYVAQKDSVSLDDVCFLMTRTVVLDELYQETVTYLPEMVYCSPISISQREFTTAIQNNLKAEKVLLINYDEYDGEKEVEYDRVKYSIYRTFVRNDGNIELYCEVRVGGN